MRDIKRVAIIGSGVAGLSCAKTLLAAGLDCVVFERGDRLGGVWADGYVGFGVQARKELYEFPDWPMPSDAPHFTPGPVFQQYLEDYVDHFGFRACIRFRSLVTELSAGRGDSDHWSITISDEHGTQSEDFDFVVIATGLYSSAPNAPSFPGASEFRGDILHNSEVKTRAPLTERNVVVVGYGKSAADIALEASEVAKTVHLVFRNTHWPVPRKVAGVLPFKWGALNRLASACVPLYQRPSALQRFLHTFGRPLTWLFWRSFELVVRLQYRLGATVANGKDLLPHEPIETDVCGEGSMVAHPDFFPRIHSGRIAMHRTEIARYTNAGVVLEDGTELAADCVVFATGWKTDFTYLSDDVRAALGNDEDGFYLYRHMLHPDLPNLAFVGRATSVSNILTHSLQAVWLAELIAGRIILPAKAEMSQEIDNIKRWKRSWMHFSSARSTRVFMHGQHYHDELMNDVGADPLRKRGLFAPLKELFAPYEPRDYRTIVNGEWERRRKPSTLS